MGEFNYDVFNSFQDGVLIIDRNRNIVFANKTMRGLCDCEDGPLRIKCHELSHCMPVPCEYSDFVCPHKEIFSAGQSINVTHIHICPSGRKMIFEITCSPIRDESGEVVLMAEILRDVTEIKTAEDTIRSKEEKLKANEVLLPAMLNRIDDAVVVVARDYRVVSANEGYLKQTKLTLSEITGRYCYEVFHHFDRPCHELGEECAVKKTFDTGKHHTALHIHRDKEDNPVYVQMNSYPIKDESGDVTSVLETLTNIKETVHFLSHITKINSGNPK